jgi:hypothetical protein
VVITCIVSFLISLPFTCPVRILPVIEVSIGISFVSQGGIYLFELLNEYAANISLIVVGFFEVFTIVYIYGLSLFE